MPLPPPPPEDAQARQDGPLPPRDNRALGEHLLRLLEETHRNSTEAVARTRWICEVLMQHGLPKRKFDLKRVERDVRRGTDLFREIKETFFGGPRRR